MAASGNLTAVLAFVGEHPFVALCSLWTAERVIVGTFTAVFGKALVKKTVNNIYVNTNKTMDEQEQKRLSEYLVEEFKYVTNPSEDDLSDAVKSFFNKKNKAYYNYNASAIDTTIKAPTAVNTTATTNANTKQE